MKKLNNFFQSLFSRIEVPTDQIKWLYSKSKGEDDTVWRHHLNPGPFVEFELCNHWTNYELEKIHIPMYKVKSKPKDIMQMILSAGVDRNILIYDFDSEPRIASWRLISLMCACMRRNSYNRNYKLTHLLVDHSFRLKKTSHSSLLDQIEIIHVNMFPWLDFFKNDLNGALAPKKKNLVIGIDATESDRVFVNPFNTELGIEALAILDSSKVLLGCF